MFHSALLSLAGFLAVTSAMPSIPGFTPKLARQDVATPDVDPNAIKSVPQSSFPTYKVGGLERASYVNESDATIAKRWTCGSSPIFTWGDNDDGGRGVTVTNADNDYRGFYIYHNSCDGYPYKYVWVAAGATQFVSLPAGFEGRMTRGIDAYNLNGSPQLLATWFEFSYDSAGVIWADVSLIRGCDGAALIWSLDNSGAWKGFTQWILDGAPTGSYDMKNDGQWVLKYTENSDGSINTAVRDWEISQVGAEYAYVDDYHGNPVISSSNGRMGSYWPAGRA